MIAQTIKKLNKFGKCLGSMQTTYYLSSFDSAGMSYPLSKFLLRKCSVVASLKVQRWLTQATRIDNQLAKQY